MYSRQFYIIEWFPIFLNTLKHHLLNEDNLTQKDSEMSLKSGCHNFSDQAFIFWSAWAEADP